ncbi:MAG: DNA-binding protein [Deltaproteobacteria bacterium]|nr:DNA-binding protein [Deltaproteobacteria bacterium]
MKKLRLSNDEIADVLERIAVLLEAQGASSFRVNAYSAAAKTVRESIRPLTDILEEEGTHGLERLPTIGKSIASVIQEYVHTGHSTLLERLEGQVSPEDLFTTVPGIGEELARRIHRELNIDTLEELELAAHDGRLESLAGFGERRVRGIRDTLAGMLSRSVRRRARRLRLLETHDLIEERPSVGTILIVDDEYRRRAKAGDLPTVSPRRFNPMKKAWLPVLHIEHVGWSFTAMYSNTALAHELGMTHDWVIIYYERDGHEDQCTVVTERRGRLASRRVIRGRESECLVYYADKASKESG